jgi:hypothetical protein
MSSYIGRTALERIACLSPDLVLFKPFTESLLMRRGRLLAAEQRKRFAFQNTIDTVSQMFGKRSKLWI